MITPRISGGCNTFGVVCVCICVSVRPSVSLSSWNVPLWTCLGPAGIYALFPLSRPTLQKGAGQKILDKNCILFSPIFAIFTINSLENHIRRIRESFFTLLCSQIHDKKREIERKNNPKGLGVTYEDDYKENIKFFNKIKFFPPVLPIKKISVWKGKHGISFIWPKKQLRNTNGRNTTWGVFKTYAFFSNNIWTTKWRAELFFSFSCASYIESLNHVTTQIVHDL